MNVKKTIKKIAALGSGAVLVGATILGAVATADIANYPAPFIEQQELASVYNAKIVVGADAATQDMLGAADLAANLQTMSYVEEELSGTTTVTVSGGETEDLDLGTDLSATWASALTDSKIDGLLDDTLSWNSEDIDFEESFNVNGLAVFTTADDEDFGGDIYLGTDGTPGDFTYLLTIDDSDFDATSVATGSMDLDLTLLGKDLTITEMNFTSNDVTFQFAEDHTLSTGEEVEVDGHTIVVDQIGSGSAAITVDGETEIISNTEDYDFGDITVEVDSILYLSDSPADSIVKLEIGSDITKTVDDGDAMEIFGYGDDNNDAEWVWSIDGTDADTFAIGAKYNQDSEKLDDEFPPKAVGEKFILPNDYGAVYIDSLTEEANVEFKVEFDDNIDLDDNNSIGVDVDNYKNAYAIKLTADVDDGFTVGAEEADTIYLLLDSDAANNNVLLTYVDEDGDIVAVEEETYADAVQADQFTTTVYAVNDENIFDIEFDLEAGNLSEGVAITLDTEDTILAGDDVSTDYLDFLTQFVGLEDAESSDIVDDKNGVSFGNYEGQYVMESGVIFGSDSGMESDLDSDEIIFTLPEDQTQATVVIEGPTSTTTSGADTIKTMVPIIPSSVLDTNAEVGSGNLIVVGGPCVNSIAFDLMGSPASCAEGFTQGKGLIKLWETGEYMAIMVAGYDAADTTAAVNKLIDYDSWVADFAGEDEVEITTSTMEAVVVTAPADNTTGDDGNQTGE